MVIVGYLSAVLVGLTLGLLGAGGAILTVPIMVYLLDVDPVLATVYSLFIVGTTTLIGAISYIKKGVINLKSSLYFAVPSVISMFITRKFIVPSLPPVIVEGGGYALSKPTFILSFFAVIMLLSSVSMIRGGIKSSKEETEKILTSSDHFRLLAYGFGVGIITGLVGAGGGFLIVPVLVLFAKLPVKTAVGTSLIIIAMNSLAGFAGDLLGDYNIDWKLLLIFLALAAGGILAGTYFSKYISPKKLKIAFGWFVLLMGVYIISKELFFKI